MSRPSLLGRKEFEGYPRAGRRTGVRNTVLVLPSVICSGVVAESIADAVPQAVCAPHDHGCGQIGADKDQTRRTLVNVAENPNVAGVVLVGLGCETLDSEQLAADLDLPVRQTSIQGVGGTDAAIDAGVSAAEELVAAARPDRRKRLTVSALTVGVTVSDLSESTVTTAAPKVGRIARALTDVGGRVVFGGVEPLVPHRDHVTELTADDPTATRLRETLTHYADEIPPTRLRSAGAERSIDAITALWDDLPIRDVLAYGDAATHQRGVSVVATDGRFEETATALAAAGAQIIVHVTGDGIPTGHPIVPVLKVTGDPETAAALPGDIDVDASRSDDRALLERVIDTAEGERTAAEHHGLSTFAISRSGPSL